MVAEGMVGKHEGKLAMINPSYEVMVSASGEEADVSGEPAAPAWTRRQAAPAARRPVGRGRGGADRRGPPPHPRPEPSDSADDALVLVVVTVAIASGGSRSGLRWRPWWRRRRSTSS